MAFIDTFNRLSRDEKQFARQLEQALTASKEEGSNDASVSGAHSDSSETPVSAVVNSSTTGTSRDGDFVPDETVSSESDDEGSLVAEEDTDSDFMASPEPKKGKKRAKENAKSAQKQKPAKTKQTGPKSISNANTNPPPRSIAKSTAVKLPQAKTEKRGSAPHPPRATSLDATKQVNLPGSKAVGSPPVLGVNRRAANWTPPARVGEDKLKTVYTPKQTPVQSGGGTPVIRVGLSRNARVKSLHSKVKT